MFTCGAMGAGMSFSVYNYTVWLSAIRIMEFTGYGPSHRLKTHNASLTSATNGSGKLAKHIITFNSVGLMSWETCWAEIQLFQVFIHQLWENRLCSSSVTDTLNVWVSEPYFEKKKKEHRDRNGSDLDRAWLTSHIDKSVVALQKSIDGKIQFGMCFNPKKPPRWWFSPGKRWFPTSYSCRLLWHKS